MAEAAIPEAHGLLSSDLPPLPENRIVVGFGMVSVDYVAIVDAFPKPDEKVRGRSLQVFGGGNAANALTCASRLGLKPKLITKVGDDALGQSALAELKADGVDTSLVKISNGGTSTSTYIIVDKQMKTRTCIYTLGVPAMVPDDLPKTKLPSALSEAKLAYFDGRSTKPGLVVAQEAARLSIPILVEAERKKAGLGNLLDLATYVICSEKFPQAWTSASSIPKALVCILLKYPTVKFVIATLGEKGCLMIDRRAQDEDPHLDAIDVDSLTESLKLRVDESVTTPTFVASEDSSMDSFLSRFFPKVYHQEKADHSTNQYCKFDSQLLTTFTSSLYLAALIASFFASTVTRVLGRKWSMLGGGITFLVGAALNGFAKDVAMLIAGRILLGIGVGFANQSSVRLRANGIGTLYGKMLLGTAEKIPPSEILDTTGAGDAFIGAVLYALCAGMPPEKMLPFACQVAAISCRAMGARTGLPQRADPRLAPFLRLG